MTARCLVVVLDGADGGLLKHWSGDGTLPHLQGLRDRGVIRRLSAPAAISDDGLWASFQYGAGPGEHGRYFWRQQLATGAMGMAYLAENGRPSFWNLLSDQGYRVAVFDIPKCGPPHPLNGLHLVDWLVHGRYFPEPLSYPQGLAAAVCSRFGAPPPSSCAAEPRPLSDGEVVGQLAHLRQSVAQKAAAARHYLQGDQWDLFLVGFKEAHCAGHLLWDLVDPRHPDHETGRSERLGHPMRVLLQDLDGAIGSLVAAAGPEAVVVVIAPTSMVPNGTLMHLMPAVLQQLNRQLGDSRLSQLQRQLWGHLGLEGAAPPLRQLPYNENAVALRYTQPSQHLPTVSPEDLQTELLERAQHLLNGLIDADTGRRVVRAVTWPSRDQPGERAAHLPDLLLWGWPGQVPEVIESPELGCIRAAPPPLRPGNHASGGLIIQCGASLSAVHGLEDVAALTQQLLDGATRVDRQGPSEPTPP